MSDSLPCFTVVDETEDGFTYRCLICPCESSPYDTEERAELGGRRHEEARSFVQEQQGEWEYGYLTDFGWIAEPRGANYALMRRWVTYGKPEYVFKREVDE